MKKVLSIPVVLGVVVLASQLASCTPAPPTPDAGGDASADACSVVTEEDAAIRYTICPSMTSGCVRLIYPDAQVVDPTFC